MQFEANCRKLNDVAFREKVRLFLIAMRANLLYNRSPKINFFFFLSRNLQFRELNEKDINFLLLFDLGRIIWRAVPLAVTPQSGL